MMLTHLIAALYKAPARSNRESSESQRGDPTSAICATLRWLQDREWSTVGHYQTVLLQTWINMCYVSIKPTNHKALYTKLRKDPATCLANLCKFAEQATTRDERNLLTPEIIEPVSIESVCTDSSTHSVYKKFRRYCQDREVSDQNTNSTWEDFLTAVTSLNTAQSELFFALLPEASIPPTALATALQQLTSSTDNQTINRAPKNNANDEPLRVE